MDKELPNITLVQLF